MLSIFAILNDEQATFLDALLNIKASGAIFLVLSCVVGCGISYCGWWCRDVTSATTFTLIGVLNKLGTVTVNLLIWDQHASWTGIFALIICLIGGAFYQQAPLRLPAYRALALKENVNVELGQMGRGG